jgi:cellulase/cellobiase CelA1
MTNKVSNEGVVATDTSGVGTARGFVSAAGYGTDKAIFGYGGASYNTSTAGTNTVSNTGVVSGDVSRVGTATTQRAAAGYGRR